MSASSTSALLYAATVAVPSVASEKPDDEITNSKAWHAKSGHGFENPWPSWVTHPIYRIVGGLIARRFTGTANVPDTAPPTVPVHAPTFLPSRTGNTSLRATWLGHACYLVEFPSGLRVLFDPVFTARCSPLSWLGPKRYTEMPCKIADIPTIDAVVISHNHYDHLSHPTIIDISQRHPECQFFVPLGNKKWFTACGIEKCTELDWWEEVDFNLAPSQAAEKKDSATVDQISVTSTDDPKKSSAGITARISCLPCQHTSSRSFNDRAATLWASWSVSSGGKSVWFGGDTGYRAVPKESDGKDDWAEEYSSLPHCPAFADIGRLRGPFDLGLIPIGAYMPRWIMSPMHADPRDAVEIFRDTKCQKALGMHWGTWVLTEEDVLEPPKLLKEALKHHSIEETGVFDVIDIGSSREF
jgi:N-acyl-phosphatidylethanolamine-hydrolysing phospholipase D